jgi:WD40 repeat protein
MTGGGELTLWETATGKEILTLDEPSACRLALSPDGRHAVVATGASQVRLWDLETRKRALELYPGFEYINSEILQTPQAFSADGKTLLLATNSTLRLFDLATGKERAAKPAHRAPCTPHFSDDGKTLFTVCGEKRCKWDVSPGKQPILLNDAPRKVWEGICGAQTYAHDLDGRLFLDHVKGTVCLRETATGQNVRAFEGAQHAFFGLLSADMTRVLLWHCSATHQDFEGIRLYDAKTGKVTGELRPVDHAGYPVFSPNGRLVALADADLAVHLYDAVSASLVRTLRSFQPLPKDTCNDASLVFSPDNEYLIVTTYLHELFSYPKDADKWNTLPTRVFHVRSGKEISRFYANPQSTRQAGRFSCSACSPDGRLLAVAEEESGSIRLIEVASGQVRAELLGHRDGVYSLAFSPDGRTLASGGQDNVTFLWDVLGTGTGAGKKASADDLPGWWADLAADDAERAAAAVASLIRTGAPAVVFLEDRLHAVTPVDPRRLARLFADLDSDSFARRETAKRELVELGERGEAVLRRALRGGVTLETRRRIEELLAKLECAPLPPRTLQALRALEVLEHIGTPEARQILAALAAGDPDVLVTLQAKASCQRLERAKGKQ